MSDDRTNYCPGHTDDEDCETDPQNPCDACREAGDRADSHAAVTNRNRATSRAEVADFMQERPERYFAYASKRGTHPHQWLRGTAPLRAGDAITTWMGDTLARVTWAGDPYRDNLGGVRQNFRARAADPNGATYSGTFYVSAGDYVRMRKAKSD